MHPSAANEPLGEVIAIHNFGAGDIIEIAPPAGTSIMLPFSNAVVPTVDLAAGRVVIAQPEEIDGDEATAGDAVASALSTCRPRERGDP